MLSSYQEKYPQVDDTVFIEETARIIGDVVIREHASIWFHTAIRGDIHYIRIGAYTNIQDNTVIHVTHDTAPVEIGDFVTVGHRALIHGCRIASNVLIGMGAILMDQCQIGANSLVAAGALVTQKTVIPPGSLAIGCPARVRRQLTAQEIEEIQDSALRYFQYKEVYLSERQKDRHHID